jgi:hypothetical protein
VTVRDFGWYEGMKFTSFAYSLSRCTIASKKNQRLVIVNESRDISTSRSKFTKTFLSPNSLLSTGTSREKKRKTRNRFIK